MSFTWSTAFSLNFYNQSYALPKRSTNVLALHHILHIPWINCSALALRPVFQCFTFIFGTWTLHLPAFSLTESSNFICSIHLACFWVQRSLFKYYTKNTIEINSIAYILLLGWGSSLCCVHNFTSYRGMKVVLHLVWWDFAQLHLNPHDQTPTTHSSTCTQTTHLILSCLSASICI